MEAFSLSKTTFLSGPRARTVRTADGRVHDVPVGWELLPPGDAAMTRRVKAAGEFWIVEERRGRKTFSQGIWAPAETIAQVRAELEAERSTESYAKRKVNEAKRREKAHEEYVTDFENAVLEFLAFHSDHAVHAQQMAKLITQHATPVGSGTVARTKTIPIEQRAEAAVIAWMRHRTTAYDGMSIPRIKGKRREVRRMLARRSRELLDVYRRGEAPSEGCPLQSALKAA